MDRIMHAARAVRSGETYPASALGPDESILLSSHSAHLFSSIPLCTNPQIVYFVVRCIIRLAFGQVYRAELE